MIQKKHIKKITTFLLLLVTILTLVACSKKESVPYGSIGDDSYLSLGNIKITEKDVYNNLRRQSGQVLPKLIQEKLFEGYKSTANDLLNTIDAVEGSDAEQIQKAFDNLVNTALFNTTDVDTIKEFKELNIKISVATFVDRIYIQNSEVNRETLKTELEDVLDNSEDNEDFATGYYKINDIRDLYLLDIQKRLYAKEILDEEVLDEDSSAYVSDANVITYYKNNIIKRHDANVFYFHFLTLNEANAALRELSLKSNSRGHWFEIPDIRLVQTIEDNVDGVTDYATYMWDVIRDTNLVDKVKNYEPGDESTGLTLEDFKRFYDAYAISESRNTKLPSEEVLNKFIELYNVVNTNKLEIPNFGADDLIGATIKFEGSENLYETEKSYDDLTDLSVSLRNYIFDTLTVEKPYSTLRSVGNFRYLMFKLDDNYNEINYVSEELDEDDNEQWVTIDELKEMLEDEDKKDDLLAALKNIEGVVSSSDAVNWEELETVMEDNITEWRNEVIKERLTSSYITTKVNEALEDSSVQIFDNTVRIFYNNSAANEATGKAKSGDVLLSFEGKLNEETIKFDIKVDDFYASVEKTIGLETAIDLILNKYLLEEYRKSDGLFKDLDLDEESYRKEYKEFINGFSNDQYASAGYPASMGRETFLLLIFGTTNVDEIIETGYIIPELRTAYSTDYDSHLGDVNVFEQLEYFTSLQYDNYKGLNVGHLLVYFDTNGDDSPENPADHFATLEPNEVTEIKEAILELYELILFEVQQSSLSGNKLMAIADEFQSYARINLGDYKPERWEKFRKLGINLKYETLSGEISNSSNFPTSSSGTLDTVFYDRAIKLYDLIMDDRDADEEPQVNNGLPYLDYGASVNIVQDPNVLTTEALDELMSSFGFHFILVSNISEKLSAEYDSADDSNEDYVVEIDDVKYNAYNEIGEKIIQSQIEYYVRGNKLEDGVILPSKVNQAFNKYFTTVFNLYNNDIMRVELLNQLLVTNDVNLHNKDTRFETIREINRNQFHNYLLGQDNNYTALYGEWFDKFGLVN